MAGLMKEGERSVGNRFSPLNATLRTGEGLLGWLSWSVTEEGVSWPLSRISSQASAEASQCCKGDVGCELKERDRLLSPARHFSCKAVAAAPICGRSGFRGL